MHICVYVRCVCIPQNITLLGTLKAHRNIRCFNFITFVFGISCDPTILFWLYLSSHSYIQPKFQPDRLFTSHRLSKLSSCHTFVLLPGLLKLLYSQLPVKISLKTHSSFLGKLFLVLNLPLEHLQKNGKCVNFDSLVVASQRLC